VPPYSVLEETMLSPASAMVWIAAVMAAMPEAMASAAMPPSIAATRFSSTSCVGFMMRV
jgi:hypothetical protein